MLEGASARIWSRLKPEFRESWLHVAKKISVSVSYVPFLSLHIDNL